MNTASHIAVDPTAILSGRSRYLHCGRPALVYMRRIRGGSLVRVHCCRHCGYELTLTRQRGEEGADGRTSR